ncbi:MAG TPA: tRNA (adenosine(37)-N6)-threonylcarbamoyltransferase complex ATPase subunit type 1 TsaE [Candidatus Bathyarchaeia archaeon]|nr:tRNA (adenosine(37)-N6)-threonylcarbamoyltransferase complex ATPase subunit type 1 TsaE [Candidatus Bathyarchaeia archaeon]
MIDQRVLIETQSEKETERLGHGLAQLLPRGAVVALRGELAAGKTCLVRGMASVFAPGELVTSPTFTLVNEYGAAMKFYHMDLYRLTDIREIADLGYEELFDPDGVCAIEWADRAENLLPQRRVDVTLEHRGEDHRRITVANFGVLPEGWVDFLTRLPRS